MPFRNTGFERFVMLATLALTFIAGCKTAGDAATVESEPAAGTSEVRADQQLTSTPRSQPANGAADESRVIAAGIEFAVPDGWLAQTPSSAMRRAEYVLPGEAGDASLIVYYFGQQGAGTRQANVRRWIGEYRGNVSSRSATRPNNELILTIVRVSGAFAPTPIDGSDAPPAKAGYTTLGVIIESGPFGPLYVKAVGPAATIEAHAARLDAFVGSARRASSAKD